MSCKIDKEAVVAAVLDAFGARFALEFPPAFDAARRRQMRAAFDGRTVTQPATAVEYWTGDWNGSRWSGERHSAAAVTEVLLACDGENISIVPPSINITVVAKTYEEWKGGAA